MTDQQPIQNIISVLESMLLRPNMYVSDDFPAIENFLNGFSIACMVCLAEIKNHYYRTEAQVRAEAGFYGAALHPVTLMIEQGLERDEIIQKAVALELETWKRLLVELPDHE
ncbi:MAG: hypothetical protein K8L91_25170 [Anaerolineae bacterium]|nr:hypothetical protein [Anaerolineae bacterium]